MWPWPPEAFDDSMDERIDDEGKRCKFCGAVFLQWAEARREHNRKKWVLIDTNGNVHDCRAVVPENEFEEVE